MWWAVPANNPAVNASGLLHNCHALQYRALAHLCPAVQSTGPPLPCSTEHWPTSALQYRALAHLCPAVQSTGPPLPCSTEHWPTSALPPRPTSSGTAFSPYARRSSCVEERRVAGTTQHNTAQHSTTQHNTAQHSTTQHNTQTC